MEPPFSMAPTFLILKSILTLNSDELMILRLLYQGESDRDEYQVATSVFEHRMLDDVPLRQRFDKLRDKLLPLGLELVTNVRLDGRKDVIIWRIRHYTLTARGKTWRTSLEKNNLRSFIKKETKSCSFYINWVLGLHSVFFLIAITLAWLNTRKREWLMWIQLTWFTM